MTRCVVKFPLILTVFFYNPLVVVVVVVTVLLPLVSTNRMRNQLECRTELIASSPCLQHTHTHTPVPRKKTKQSAITRVRTIMETPPTTITMPRPGTNWLLRGLLVTNYECAFVQLSSNRAFPCVTYEEIMSSCGGELLLVDRAGFQHPK